jgi:hypothetical protein
VTTLINIGSITFEKLEVNHDQIEILLKAFVIDYFNSQEFEQLASHQDADSILMDKIAISLTNHFKEMYDLNEVGVIAYPCDISANCAVLSDTINSLTFNLVIGYTVN